MTSGRSFGVVHQTMLIVTLLLLFSPTVSPDTRVASGRADSVHLLWANEGGMTTRGSEDAALGASPNEWTNAFPGPPARFIHAMAYDAESDRTIVFGGLTESGLSNDTWAYEMSTNNWTNEKPAPAPAPRTHSAVAYDLQSDRVVLFGGFDGSQAVNETWSYDWNNNKWTDQKPTISPPARWGHAMAYDNESDRIVLFEGVTGTDVPDTWAYDVDTNTWTNKSPVVSPHARFRHSMAYDSRWDRVIMFGGYSSIGTLNDTWAYDVNTNTWTEMRPVTSPTARWGHAMAYDNESSRVVLFGGYTSAGESDETWTYDFGTNAWTERTPVVRPSGRDGHRMVYDSRSDRVVIFGGFTTYPGAYSDEAWAFDLNRDAWTNLSPATSPSPRGYQAMTYDAKSDRVVLFGGLTIASFFSFEQFNDTWAYDLDANAWTNRDPGTAPSARENTAMAYDAQSDRIILFGGRAAVGSLDSFDYYGDTWVYDFGNNTWLKMNPVVSPSPRSGHAMAYDAQSDRIILFGGFDDFFFLGDTWAYDFDHDTWAIMNPVFGPSARARHAMAYDSESDRIVLFGGPDDFPTSETWAYDFDKDAWTNMDPSVRPSPRARHAMAYNAKLDRIVLFGGSTGAGDNDETWTYDLDANVWTNLNPGVRPTRRQGHAMAYDAQSDRTVLFGGYTGGYSHETWSYENPATYPSAPRSLRATAGPRQIVLAWQVPTSDGGSPITNYEIYRRTAWDAESLVATVGDVLTFTDLALVGGVTNYYRVRAVNVLGRGPFSEPASAAGLTVPAAVEGLGGAAGDARVTLTWLPPSLDGGAQIAAYRIYRGTGAGAESFLAAVGKVLTYTDSGVTNGVTYFYQVTAVNVVGEGPPSNEVSVMPRVPADTENPTVSITSPAAGLVLSSPEVKVTGTASDDVAIGKVEISSDGTNWVLASGTTEWSGSLTLRTGVNTIHARATDTSGNEGTAVILVTVEPAGLGVGLSPFTVVFTGVAIVAATVAPAIFLIWRTRRKERNAEKKQDRS